MLCFSLVGLSCAADPSTQVVVLMDTDYAVPVEVDRLRARVSKIMETDSGSEELETWTRVFSVSNDVPSEPSVYALPATFGIVPHGPDLDREIVIELEALATGSERVLVSRRVKTGFVRGEAWLVRMLLYRACAGMTCSVGETCGCQGAASCAEPSCVDERLSPEDLEPIDNPGILPPDAGIPDSGAPDDAGPTDGGVPPDDGGTEPDAGMPDGGGINCGAPLTICGFDCVNTQADPRFCGDCDTECPDGHICDAGSCLDPGDCRTNGTACSGFTYCDEGTGQCLPGCTDNEQCTGDFELCDIDLHECICAVGLERCGSACVDTQIDSNFCGSCLMSCPTGNVCEAGMCVDRGDCRTNGIDCTGFTYCDQGTGDCRPGCAEGEQCTGGNEICDLDLHDCVCDVGLERCGTDCIDTQIDPNFCGNCVTPCPAGNVCEAGTCLDSGDCRTNGVGCSGFTYCDELTGDCLRGCADNTQCTGENEQCDVPTHACICSPGFHLCDAVCVSDLDVNSCGLSCAPCPAPPNSIPTCSLGACGFTCDDTYKPCDLMCCPTICPPGQVLYNRACAQAHTQIADEEGNRGEHTSLALDAADSAHVGYYAKSGRDLAYAAQQADGSWISQRPDGMDDVGQYASLAFDPAGALYIAYYNASVRGLMLATQQSDVSWTIEVVDDVGDVGEYVSIAFDASGVPHISYYDKVNKDLMYATRPIGGAWTVETVDGASDVGQHTSLALDSSGAVHVSYYDASDRDLKYATQQGDGSWIAHTIASDGDVGKYTSLAIDGTGVAHISYYGESDKDLLYAVELAPDSWMTETIESQGDVGKHTSLALDGAGAARISYFDETARDLKYATQLPDESWAIQVVDTEGDVGRYTSIAVDSLGHAHISYYDATGSNLKYALIAAPE